MSTAKLATDALQWADMVMEATFFIMQTYLTEAWKLSFTSAAAFLNIWGGIYRILPIFFLFLADTFLGNFLTLALSAILTTTGLVLITMTTWPGYGCDEKEEGECNVGRRQKIVFITGMALIALGKAARFASTKPFIDEQNSRRSHPTRYCVMILFVTPVIGFFVFPYVNKWHILFGVSTVCTALASLFYLSCFCLYNKPRPNPAGSPITDFFRVFVAAAFKISQPFPTPTTLLHRVDGEEFQSLSSSRIFGFLHKAAIVVDSDRSNADGGVKKRSWRVCSVSEVESAKVMIRMLSVYGTYLFCGVVASTADTYFVEQATNMNTNIGHWKAPLQLFLLIFMFYKFLFAQGYFAEIANEKELEDSSLEAGMMGTVFAVVYCAVAAAVERRRLHVARRHGILDQPDAKTPMSVFWLIFQVCFLGIVEALVKFGLLTFHEDEGPKSMKRYEECLSEGVSGVGFVCGAVVVYVVGKISETGGSNNWFQQSLNMSRLDRYYWVLASIGSVNFIVTIFVIFNYRNKKTLIGEPAQELEASS